MASVPLSQLNRGAITLAPPWSKRVVKLGLMATPRGVTPPQLERYKATGMNENLKKAIAIVKANSSGTSRKRR